MVMKLCGIALRAKRGICDPLKPVEVEFKVQADPVFEKHNIKPELAKDLQTIAAIDSLLQKLSPKLRASLQEAIKKAVGEDKRLPTGSSIEFE